MTAQQPSATQPLSHTLASVLQTISSTQQLSNDAIHALSLLVGSSTLIDALDLVDKQSGEQTRVGDGDHEQNSAPC